MSNTSKLPCCGYIIDECEVGPIFWNRNNNCVQCHACGTVFEVITKSTPSADTLGKFIQEVCKDGVPIPWMSDINQWAELNKQPDTDASTPITKESK